MARSENLTAPADYYNENPTGSEVEYCTVRDTVTDFSADWHEFMAAAENANDTSVEVGFETFSAEWFESWSGSYQFLRDEGYGETCV
jgi:S-adenosylmethionine synthetase